MEDQPKPMLNTPIRTGIAAGEEFAANAIARMDRTHGHLQDWQQPGDQAELQAEKERLEKWKQGIVARFSELTGLQFDANGKCLTPGGRMRDHEKEWTQVCREITAQNNSQSQGEPQDK